MRSILVLLEDLVQQEFSARDLAETRSIAQEKLQDVGRLEGASGRVMAFIEALADVRRRPVTEVYQFVALKLVPLVLKEYQSLLKGYTSARSVLLQITRIAPAALDTLIPGIPSTDFDVELLDLDTLRVRFDGPIEMLAALEGAAIGLALHYGERAEARRVEPPVFAPTRRMLDIKVAGERRDTKKPADPPSGGDGRRRLTL